MLALIDHELRFLESRRAMRELLHQGAIGTVRHAGYLFRSDYRGDRSLPWDWWSDAAMGGGALGAVGSHVIDSFRWMLGAEISRVFGMLTTHVAERPAGSKDGYRQVTSDDETKLLLHFADSGLTGNTTGQVSISLVESGRAENQLAVYGSEGALMVEEGGELWRARAGSREWQRIQAPPETAAPGMRPSSWSRGFTAFSRAIVEALRAGRNSLEGAAAFADGYRTQLVLDAARASHNSGCWVVPN